MGFINLTAENLQNECLCCILRTRTKHPGVEAKRKWLAPRIQEGHIYRKLDENVTVFAEYAPLETAWIPIEGQNYMYLYCLWVEPAQKGKGYGSALMCDCLEDAKAKGKSGVCMLGSEKQKAWLSDQTFAKKFGFEVVDSTAYGYDLLAISFDGTVPHFTDAAKQGHWENENLTIFYDDQCPFVFQTVQKIKQECMEKGIPAEFNYVDSLEKAKNMPGVFNNWAVFYRGKMETVNLLDSKGLEKILSK